MERNYMQQCKWIHQMHFTSDHVLVTPLWRHAMCYISHSSRHVFNFSLRCHPQPEFRDKPGLT